MKITNTSQYPDKEVKQLIGFSVKRLRKILPKHQYQNLNIRVTNTKRAYSGRAWSSYHYRILIRLGNEYPVEHAGYGWKYKTAPEYSLATWQEALVAIAAHESYHIIQFHKKTKRSEIKAEKFAVKVLERYRAKES